jgi:hypothetical protein
MVKLLVDESLPEALVASGTPDVSFVRWQGEGRSDVEFVRFAAQEGFDGVVFLGPSVLARANVVQATADARVQLIATSTDDPTDALRDISRNLHSITKARGTRPLLVLSHGVRTMPPHGSQA